MIKKLQTRIMHKHDTTENWNKSNFIPESGELVVYTDTNMLKVGDGSTDINNLSYVGSTYGTKIDRSGAPDVPLDSDWRYNEAIGTASVASGMGAVAYSRASKSLGYRTQTGYPPTQADVDKRPEATVLTDTDGNIMFPEDNKGQAAVAIGSDTVAVANNSFAAGYRSKALGTGSFAVGSNAEVIGVNGAAAFGRFVKTSGASAFCTGIYTEAAGSAQTVVGKYNKVDNTRYAFIVGNGTGAATSKRSNALEVDWSGNGYFSGNVFVNNQQLATLSEVDLKISQIPLPTIVTTTSSGLMSSEDKVILDNIASISLSAGSGEGAIAFGEATVSSGQYAVATGYGSEASGIHSFATGHQTRALGSHSFTTGYTTEARAKFSSAFGYGTHTADADCMNIDDNTGIAQMVVGTHNAYENGEIDDALFVVGNGNYTNNVRKNAFVVRRDGSIQLNDACYGTTLPDTQDLGDGTFYILIE